MAKNQKHLCYWHRSFSKITNFETKKNIKSSNHFKVDIIKSLILDFDSFALDGAKLYHVKVHEKKTEKKNLPWEIYIGETLATTCSTCKYIVMKMNDMICPSPTSIWHRGWWLHKKSHCTTTL
jgi:hypothetical protein